MRTVLLPGIKLVTVAYQLVHWLVVLASNQGPAPAALVKLYSTTATATLSLAVPVTRTEELVTTAPLFGEENPTVGGVVSVEKEKLKTALPDWPFKPSSAM